MQEKSKEYYSHFNTEEIKLMARKEEALATLKGVRLATEKALERLSSESQSIKDLEGLWEDIRKHYTSIQFPQTLVNKIAMLRSKLESSMTQELFNTMWKPHTTGVNHILITRKETIELLNSTDYLGAFENLNKVANAPKRFFYTISEAVDQPEWSKTTNFANIFLYDEETNFCTSYRQYPLRKADLITLPSVESNKKLKRAQSQVGA